jgi:hypothetical protein
MKPKLAHRLATEIATRLLTTGPGPRGHGHVLCDRLQLMKKDADGVEHNMGGRDRGNVIDAVEELLLRTRP